MSICEDCPAMVDKSYQYEACCGMGIWARGRGLTRGKLPDTCPYAEALKTVAESPDKYRLVAVPTTLSAHDLDLINAIIDGVWGCPTCRHWTHTRRCERYGVPAPEACSDYQRKETK